MQHVVTQPDSTKSVEIVCNCHDTFAGAFCETKQDFCTKNNIICENQGTCVSDHASFECKCKPTFTGEHCETKVIPCENYNCGARGSCIYDTFAPKGVEIYLEKCSCFEGSFGSICQYDVDECQSRPCRNSGLCENLEGAFECECMRGYLGVLCEIEIDECESSPCKNGGVCVDRVDKYECSCDSSKFTGKRCETAVDQICQMDCGENGACDSTINRCVCVLGYQGDHCEIVDDEQFCKPNPCKNNGVCYPNTVKQSFTCICSPGYKGQVCEQPPGPCDLVNCVHGECQIETSQCLCKEGWEGQSCDKAIEVSDNRVPIITVIGVVLLGTIGMLTMRLKSAESKKSNIKKSRNHYKSKSGSGSARATKSSKQKPVKNLKKTTSPHKKQKPKNNVKKRK